MPRILILEPEKQLASAINAYLSNSGFTVKDVADSQSAILDADKNLPDLVVLEIAIAKNNGIAFLQEFRSYTDWVKIPVIIYSRVPREDTGLSATQWQKYGVMDYLYKPTHTLGALAARIKEILGE